MERAGLEGDLVYEGDFTYDLGHAAALRMLAGTQLPDAVIGAQRRDRDRGDHRAQAGGGRDPRATSRSRG